VPSWSALYAPGGYHFIEWRRGTQVYREHYDLASDPHEVRNLLKDGQPGPSRATVRALRRALAAARACAGARC
jgi:hypothetical protein